MSHQRTRTKEKPEFSDWLLDAVKVVFLFVFTLMCIYPFYYVIIYSISDPNLAKTGIFLLPKGFTLNSYISMLELGVLPHAFLISVLRTVIGTFGCVLVTTMYAYLMTKDMLGKKIVYRFSVCTMYFSAGLIPWFITMRTYGLANNFLLYVIPGLMNAYHMILVKTFIEQLPPSLEESAALEGAGFAATFFKIIVPLSKPIIATTAVYCAVGQWNSWQDNYFLVSSPKLQTAQMVLQNYLKQTEAIIKEMTKMNVSAEGVLTTKTVQMTAVVVTMVPIMLVYPYAQRYFTKGIMMGAVKG